MRFDLNQLVTTIAITSLVTNFVAFGAGGGGTSGPSINDPVSTVLPTECNATARLRGIARAGANVP